MSKKYFFLYCILLILLSVSACKDYDNPEDEDIPFASPSNLKVRYAGVNEISINWDDNSSIEEGFRIILSGAVEKSQEVAENITTCTFKNVTPGEYKVEVIAFVNQRPTYPLRMTFNFKEKKPVFGKLSFPERETNFISVLPSLQEVDSVSLLEYGICWSLNENPTVQDSCRKVTSTDSIKFSGLTPNTHYYFRTYVKSYSGIYYGVQEHMQTYRVSKERIVMKINPNWLFNHSVELQVQGSGVSVDWGDGAYEVISNVNLKHNYDSDTKREVVFYGNSIFSLTLVNTYLTNGARFYNTCDADFIDVSKAASLSYLNANSCSLTSLDVSTNVKLISLLVAYNSLTSLNVRNNVNLRILNCNDNPLGLLDLNKNENLENLNCSNNHLASLDVSKNTHLNFLSCDDNQLIYLDVSNNQNLNTLNVNNNILNRIDLSNNNLLKSLSCYRNHISSLDLSVCPLLIDVNCSYNFISKIDLSKLIKLNRIIISGNLMESLDLSNNLDLITIGCSENHISMLNLSKQVKLEYLNCGSNVIFQIILPEPLFYIKEISFYRNLLTACSLNAIFEKLPDIAGSASSSCYIHFSNNPGSATCNSSIAINKKWLSFSEEGDGSAICNN